MKAEKFNIIGITSFRCKNQVQSYSQLLEFLEIEIIKNEGNNEINEMNKKFIEYCKREGIYKYKEKEVIKRIQMAIKLFKQIKIIDIVGEPKKISIITDALNDFYKTKPENFFFRRFMIFFPFFSDAIKFLINYANCSIGIKDFIVTLLIYETEEDDFSNLYNYVEKNKKNNYRNLIIELSYKLLGTKNLSQIEPENFYKYKKPPFGKKENKEKLLSLLKKKKNNEFINKQELFFWLKWDPFKEMFKNDFFGSYKENKNKFYKNEYFNYLSTVTYEQLILDLTSVKISKLILCEYYDIVKRWLNNFQLLEKDKIKTNNISFSKNQIKLNIKEDEIQQYPFDLVTAKNYLIKIQENDFSFKETDINLAYVANSTIAEYFVNLYYSIKLNINVKGFKKFSRTILQTGTLYPHLHAPGRGPDFLHVINNKLRILETTIHRSNSSVKKNEIFSVIEHVDLKKINYLDTKIKQQINQTEIILITPIKKENDLKDIKKIICALLSKEEQQKNNKTEVTNFNKFIDKKW